MLSQKRIALVDCNNFYVSCERLFRPDLLNKPVAVLSNNDACIVSRSAEVKALGIKMAVPVHQIKALINQHDVQLFSSNYALYADLSSRVMSLLSEFSPHQEIYSIDESFLDLTGISAADPVAYGALIRQTIMRQTGIPVCVGMGPTKTLAKLANYAAKRWQKTQGVVDLACPERRKKLMQVVPVREIWGIGSKLSSKLNTLGITHAWDLACLPSNKVTTQFNIVVARTVMELNGIPCFPLEKSTPDKQQIVCSRSFKQKLTTFDELAQAITQYTSRAAEKLRKQNSLTHLVSVSIQTNPLDSKAQHYRPSARCTLPSPSQDSRLLITTAKKLLKQIFKPGLKYQKASVTLAQLHSNQALTQTDLFPLSPTSTPPDNKNNLMQTMDEINLKFPNKIALSDTQLRKNWLYQPKNKSKRYTTDWNEIAKVACS